MSVIRSIRPLVLIVCLLTIAVPVAAQDGPPLTLQAALDEALSRNPELIALRARLEADRQRPGQERYLMPLMLEAQIWQWPLNRINPAGATYMFMAEQMIPGRGKRTLRERLMTAEVEAGAAAIPVRARDIVGNIKRTYAEIFVARKAVEVTTETIALLRQIAEGTQVRYAAGRGSQQDILKVIVEITRLHEEELRLVEQARMGEARLNTLLGRDPAAPVGALAEPREDAVLPPVAELQRMAIERQPELAMARAEIAVADAAVEVVRSARRPDYFVRGGYMLMPGEAGAFTAGVGITWNNAPWSRGRNDLAEQEAGLAVTASRAGYDAAVNNLRLMVQEAYIRVESAAGRASLLRTSLVPQSSQALDVSRVGYQSDRGDFLDIIDNQRLLAAARLGYYRALADLEQARADLDRAVGITAFRGGA
ncbi:MAG: TolC family protein [Acidobacteria bacterium]|nr:TolC family protein [Acidobacteriota bacterium]